MSGCTGGTGVGHMAIGPSPPHPGIETVTSIPATWHPSHLRSKSANWLTLLTYTDIPISFPKVKWSEVAQLCPTLCDPMNWGLPGSSVHGIFLARILEWVSISFSRGSSQPRDRTWVSHIVGRCFTIWATNLQSRTQLSNLHFHFQLS